MDGVWVEDGAFAETVVFLSHFKDLPDARHGEKVRYPLPEVLLPRLLAVLGIAEGVVAIDGMGCQRAIAPKTMDQRADHILSLRGNQGSPRKDVELFVAEQKAKDFQDTTVTHHQTVDSDHGRIETHDIIVIHDVGWIRP